MASRNYNRIKGHPFEKLDIVRYTGTTAALANDMQLNKPSSVFKKLPLAIHAAGEGVYIEDNDTLIEGYNFPIAEAVVEAGAVTYQKMVHLGDNIIVAAFVDGGDSSKGKIRAGKAGLGGTVSWGDVAVFNNAATTDIGLCKVNSTTYAVTYCDDGDANDLLSARMGTVSTTTYAITQGDERQLTTGAAGDTAKTTGTACCIPRTGVLFVAYVSAADTKGYGVAATFSGTTVAAPGTVVEFDGGGDAKEVSCCSHDTGDVTVVYQEGSDANDPITACCGTVSAAGIIVFGDEVSMAGTAAAATSISCVSPVADLVVFTWIDSTFVHINCCTISGTTPTKKTELELTAAASLTPGLIMLGKEKFAVVFENDAHTNDAAQVILATLATTTFTAGSTFQVTEASTQGTVGCQLDDPDNDAIAIFFDDAGASNAGKILIGHYRYDLIDVRSNVASAKYVLWTTPTPGRKRKA